MAVLAAYRGKYGCVRSRKERRWRLAPVDKDRHVWTHGLVVDSHRALRSCSGFPSPLKSTEFGQTWTRSKAAGRDVLYASPVSWHFSRDRRTDFQSIVAAFAVSTRPGLMVIVVLTPPSFPNPEKVRSSSVRKISIQLLSDVIIPIRFLIHFLAPTPLSPIAAHIALFLTMNSGLVDREILARGHRFASEIRQLLRGYVGLDAALAL